MFRSRNSIGADGNVTWRIMVGDRSLLYNRIIVPLSWIKPLRPPSLSFTLTLPCPPINRITLRTTSTHLINMSRDGDSPLPWTAWHPPQFPISNLNICCFSLKLFLLLPLVSWEKRPTTNSKFYRVIRSPESPFLQAKQPQLPQPLLTGLMLQTSPTPLLYFGYAPELQLLCYNELYVLQ